MSIRSDKVLVEDILGAIEKIEFYVCNSSYSDFLNDTKTQDAVVRNIEIIGEAAKNISDLFKEENIEIPWDKIIGTRNRLIHNYSGVNLDILWNIIKDDLPNLYLILNQDKDNI